MKEFNITAQIYDKNDKDKQTILINKAFFALSKEKAITMFYDSLDENDEIMKIYSVEEISKAMA